MRENMPINLNIGSLAARLGLRRGSIFGAIIMVGLLAFELFNYSTTDYALTDLLGKLNFFGIRWATILSIAFCGIDFAGIARLFTPEQGPDVPKEAWYLFGAWLLAATMNAMLTWWGVSLAVMTEVHASDSILNQQVMLRVVPIFVAIMVWLIRILIIGTFSVAGDRLFSQGDRQELGQRSYHTASPGLNPRSSVAQPAFKTTLPSRASSSPVARPAPAQAFNLRSAARSGPTAEARLEAVPDVQEPTYHPVQMNAANSHPARAVAPSRSFASRSSTSMK